MHNVDGIENDEKDNGNRKRKGPFEQTLNGDMITEGVLEKKATIEYGTKPK